MSCTLACTDVEELIADHAAGRLLWIERVRLFAHLWTCRRCRAASALSKRAV